MSGYAKRTDGNHKQVKADLEAAMPGVSVFDASGMGKGFPDLVIGLFKRTWLVEIKDPTKSASRRRLTAAQVGFHENWKGEVITACSAAEVYAHMARVFYKELT